MTSKIESNQIDDIGHRKIKCLKKCKISYCDLMSNRECGVCDWHHQLWADRFGKHAEVKAQ